MKKASIYIIFFIFTGCSAKYEMQPDWFIKTTEQSKLEIENNKLYLIEGNTNFEIDVPSRTKTIRTKHINKTLNNIGETGNKNNLQKWELLNTKSTYSLIEYFSFSDDCQDSLHKYWLEQIDENGKVTKYTLGKSERTNVIDFVVLKKTLYIIKNPANGGDAFFLEKYNLL